MTKIMGGWVTWTSAIAMFFTGVGTVIASINFETFTLGEGFNEGVAMILVAGGMVGIGRKVEKNGPIVNEGEGGIGFQ